MTCENNCYLDTPTSEMEKQQQDSYALAVAEEGQGRQPCPSAEMETPCCGCATEQAVDSQGVVAVDDPWEWDTQHVQRSAEEQWDAPMSEDRRSFLQVWWKYFKGNTF